MEREGGCAAAKARLAALVCSAGAQENVLIKTGWRAGLGVFSCSPSFVSSASLSAPEREELSARISEDALFSRAQWENGYLNVFPSDLWYALSLAFLREGASFSAWRVTEEDFGFYADASPAAAQVQKSFVRLCSALRSCRAEGMTVSDFPSEDFALLTPEERALVFSLCRLADAGEGARFPLLQETARAFHLFYDTGRIWSPEPRRAAARHALALCCGAWMQRAIHEAGLFPPQKP